MATATAITCYGATQGPDWRQEVYETASRDAGKRAREVRKAGFQVVTAGMGTQVTPMGTVKLSIVTIERRGDDGIRRLFGADEVPPVRVVRL